ncbi:hypothetical protein SAE02_43890 [Skermanella aerolata]|uniref:Uncharacterized protein n=1 Tax=Skermanella aerolata TaxID=393310 RepID=A0A512DUU1_9PROT|nr:hypothetical protein [Skermanella aerolata]KJB95144.1 hypothetical protein N826_06730 [Skermanella aerolata KACC 11604]GEO40241.1 hypothetical protein SAE02_43890 [Skermanella aerolata]
MTSFLKEFRLAAWQTPRMYFAPLIGALKAIQVEAHELAAEGVQKKEKNTFGKARIGARTYGKKQKRRVKAFG